MLTDFSIAAAKKLARVKKSVANFRLIITRIDLVHDRLAFLARTRLNEVEKKYFDSLRNQKRRSEWLAGRIAAKEAASKLIVCEGNYSSLPFRDYQSLAVSQNDAGKPYITSHEKGKIDISISHSDNLAVGMASFLPCGVDIQKVDSKLERVQRYFVSTREMEILDELGEIAYSTRQRLALLWSAKEALKKQCGLNPLPGFLSLELVDLRLGDLPVFVLTLPSGKDKKAGFKEIAVTFYGKYSLAWIGAPDN